MLVAYAQTGLATSFEVYDEDGHVWNGSAFVAYDSDDFEDYRVTSIEVPDSGRYEGTAPTGTKSWILRVVGDTLAESYPIYEGAVQASSGATTTKNLNVDLIDTSGT